MVALPTPLQPLAAFKQFILWTTRDGRKFPINGASGQVADAHDPAIWLDADTALTMAGAYGPDYGVGFVFTEYDPFFFVDIDKCLNPDGVTWSALALDLLARFEGAAVEVSQSGRGLHIFGVGHAPDHATKNIPLGIEFYTDKRFVALTGTNAIGSADTDHTAALAGMVRDYFPPRTANDMDWTDGPVEGYTGPTDDDELIRRALGAKSAAGIFSGRATFAQLWEGDDAVLDVYGGDASSADAALAQHLAFWTGKDCERILRLMRQSGLVREKWGRDDYMHRTILGACRMQTDVYSAGGPVVEISGAATLSGSEGQVRFAEGVRAAKLADVPHGEDRERLLAVPSAKFWLENKDRSVAELVAALTPVANVPAVRTTREVTLVEGVQYLAGTGMADFFKGCVYVQDIHRILVPSGATLKPEQFNAMYGGYSFQMDWQGEKVTKKAWEAFTESQAMRFPKVESLCFRPDLEPGEIVETDGHVRVNSYVPANTPRAHGDVTPFTAHLNKLLPNERDRTILLSYMAACVQYKGIKFQWAPLIQGTEGNGKTLLTQCVAEALGRQYVHFPKADDLDNKFNAWMLGNILIGVEDIYVPENRASVIEALKPMITGGRGMEIQFKGADQFTSDVCANFMLNSNHKNAIRFSESGRRFAIFYTAQQSAADIIRDGMGGDYFPALYDWLNTGGYAIVSQFLEDYRIPDEFNPATKCHRAPQTSSTDEAVMESLGSIEQEILEAVEEGRVGFAGGWISSVAVERLLQNLRAGRSIPHNKRRQVLQTLGYDWHPGLKEGRVNNPIGIDDNKKPRLFIKRGHPMAGLESPAEIAQAYQEAQGVVTTGRAAEVFSR